MKNKLLLTLFICSSTLLVLLIGFLIGSGIGTSRDNRDGTDKSNGKDKTDDRGQKDSTRQGQKDSTPQGGKVVRDDVPNPGPPPKKVANPDRVKQNLRPGKTYVTHTKGVLNVRSEDKDWGITGVGTTHYAFE